MLIVKVKVTPKISNLAHWKVNKTIYSPRHKLFHIGLDKWKQTAGSAATSDEIIPSCTATNHQLDPAFLCCLESNWWSWCRWDLRAVFNGEVEVSEWLWEPRTLQAWQQRGPTDAAVRILLVELISQPVATWQAAKKVREEVAAEDHVNPGVAAAVEARQQGRECDDGVLRICRETGRKTYEACSEMLTNLKCFLFLMRESDCSSQWLICLLNVKSHPVGASPEQESGFNGNFGLMYYRFFFVCDTSDPSCKFQEK